MITYFATIPAAAVKSEIDGHLYAHLTFTLKESNGKVTVTDDGEVRMLRVHEVRPTNGTATVIIGKAGDAIATLVNLPFSVTAVPEKKFTTFPNEELLYEHPNGEALVAADTATGRAFVAVTKDGYRTDYPVFERLSGSSTTRWDNPEWFTKGFREKCLRVMLVAGR